MHGIEILGWLASERISRPRVSAELQHCYFSSITCPPCGSPFSGKATTARVIHLQGLLCGVLQVIVQKLAESEGGKGTVMQYADQIMEALLSVFSNRHEPTPRQFVNGSLGILQLRHTSMT